MDYLDRLESESIYAIREAYTKIDNIAVLWSMGKDSTALLYLIRKAFFGEVPFPVVHIDTGFKFKEIYEFRDKMVKEWNLNLIVAENREAKVKGVSASGGKFQCCNSLKTEALKQLIKERGFKAIYLGIRRDEHGIRAKERVFSPRGEDFIWDYLNQPPELWQQHSESIAKNEHIRVHPLLGFSELDVWKYIKREHIPVVSLYFAKAGRRYRSIGCECCCSSFESKATSLNKIIKELNKTNTSERSGRAQDKEDSDNMQKLRSLGYM